MNHEQLVWLSERYKTRTFKSEPEARDELLSILIYLAMTSFGVRDLSATQRLQEKKRAMSVPLYQTASGWKIGIRIRTRVAKPKFSWDQLTIKRNSISALTVNGYVNMFDNPRLGPVKIVRLDGLTLTEGNKDQEFIASTAQAIKDHNKVDFLAIVVDADGNLIDGHHRWYIAKALGMKTVPAQEVTYPTVANPRHGEATGRAGPVIVRRPVIAPLSRAAMLARRKRERAIERAVVRALDPHDPRLGLKPEYQRRHRAGCDPTTGFCSVAVEAMWALLGGNAAGYERRQIRHEGSSHWFLADVVGRRYIDPTAAQFATPVPYAKGRGRGTPITRKTGVTYRGDPALLISNKAAHLIALTDGRAPQRNPAKRPLVAKAKKVAALPRSVKFIVVEPETDLFRGSSNPDDWHEERQWFTDSIDTAVGYMEGRDGPWAIVWFSTTRPLRLIHLANYKALDRLMRALGIAEYDGDPHDAAPAVCALGLDGWLIDEGAHGGTDTLLCDAASSVQVVRGVEQSDDWDWRRWKGY